MMNKTIGSRVAALIFAVLMVQTAFSQGPPIFTDTPVFLGLEGRGLRTFGRYAATDNLDAWTVPVVLPYNIRTRFMVGGILPFRRISAENGESATGIGDLGVFAKLLLLQRDGLRRTFRIALKLQENFPTGNNDDRPFLGLGAYQTTAGFTAAWITTAYGIYGEATYRAISQNIPDRIIYNVAVGVPLLPVTFPPKQLNIFLEITGQSQISGDEGIIFLAPGMQLIPSKRYLIEAGIQFPLKENTASSNQTNYIITAGTRILIF